MDTTIPLGDVEQELSRQLKAAQGSGEAPVQRARMSNLVVFCNSRELADRVSADLPSIVAVHPTRVLLLIGEPEPATEGVTATVAVCHRPVGEHRQVCTEQVTLHAGGPAVDHLPFAVRSLLISDLPTNLWWAAPVPPPLGGPLLYELSETAQQVIYDSLGWPEPARGVVATATWLENVHRQSPDRRWRVAADLNWRRFRHWRRLLAQALDPASAPGAIESINEVLLEHGPHAVIQAWELTSWLAQRLGWQVLTGRVQPGHEIGWRFLTPQGDVRVRIRRLEQGPPELRRVRVACKLFDKPGALNLVAEDAYRMMIVPEGIDAAPRTLTVPPQTPADLVGRQLSDRERDPVFRESMSVAESLARSVLKAVE